MHDARRHHDGVDRRHVLEQRVDGTDQAARRQLAMVEMDLQRSDAGRQVDHARQRRLLDGLHQRVHLETQVNVQHQVAKLGQQIVIAGAAIQHPGAVAIGAWP